MNANFLSMLQNTIFCTISKYNFLYYTIQRLQNSSLHYKLLSLYSKNTKCLLYATYKINCHQCKQIVITVVRLKIKCANDSFLLVNAALCLKCTNKVDKNVWLNLFPDRKG